MQKIREALKRHPHAILLPCIWLITLIAFFPTFFNDFQMEWDDQWMVVNPFTIGHLNWDLIVEIFTAPFNGQWGPLNQIMYTLIYNIWGFNPMAFHLVSLAIHMLNIMLVYVLLNKILIECTLLSERRRLKIILITSTLFAIHPLQVETIAWVSASKILLSSTFYLSSAYALTNYLSNKRNIFYVFSLVLFLLSYLCKEQVVVFPLFTTLIVVWYGIQVGTQRFILVLTPIYLMSLVMCLHEVFYVANYHLYIQGETYNWWQRLIFAFYSLATYLFKWLFPIRLNWMYHFPFGINDTIALWVYAYPVLVCIMISSIWRWLSKPIILSATLFFLIHLLLVLHIIILPRGAIVADRYMYLSVIGLNFFIAYFLTAKNLIIPKGCRVLILSLLFGTCVAISFYRTKDWKDSQTLRNIKTKQKNIVLVQNLF